VYDADGDSTRPIAWDGAAVVEIGSFGGTRGEANDINNAGKVTGWSNLPDDAVAHAYVWDGNTFVDIGTLPDGLNSIGYSINKAGDVAGKADISGVGWRAFLWDRKQLYDLNELVDASDPLKPFVTLAEARGINDRGWIVANGADVRTGQTHGYLLTPIQRKK
jgi:probable HAF family extracellular repeat protein